MCPDCAALRLSPRCVPPHAALSPLREASRLTSYGPLPVQRWACARCGAWLDRDAIDHGWPAGWRAIVRGAEPPAPPAPRVPPIPNPPPPAAPSVPLARRSDPTVRVAPDAARG